MMTLHRAGSGPWAQHIGTTELWPLRQVALERALGDSGFDEIECWGDMEGNPFDADHSPNLIVTGRVRGR